MATAEQTSSSILPEVAKHERELLAKLEAAEQEARRLVDQARSEAQQHLQAEEERLNQDVAAMRRDAEAKRNAEYDEVIRSAEKRLESVRQEASAQVDGMAQEILGMFMPGNAGRSGS